MTISRRSLVASIALLIILVGTACASPDFGSNCTSCHTRADGAFNFLPSNLLQIAPGQSKGITINVTDTATGVPSALSLTGLNSAGLGATASPLDQPRRLVDPGAVQRHRTEVPEPHARAVQSRATIQLTSSSQVTPCRRRAVE